MQIFMVVGWLVGWVSIWCPTEILQQLLEGHSEDETDFGMDIFVF